MISPLDMLWRLALAAVLGAVIGINRERHEWAAGMRTHMLVSVGAALAMIVSAFGFNDVLMHEHVVLDPSRIAAQVVSGIGFLGAGTILFLQREQVVRGLTTAAGLWATAAIGLAAGSGLYLAAAMATAVIWLILAALKPLERRLFARRLRGVPRLRLRLGAAAPLAAVEALVARQHLPLRKMILRRHEDGEDRLDLLFGTAVRDTQLLALAEELRKLEGLQAVLLEPAPGTVHPPAD
jgi:putative Mg2+ transporter-C (MgtC) family protein